MKSQTVWKSPFFWCPSLYLSQELSRVLFEEFWCGGNSSGLSCTTLSKHIRFIVNVLQRSSSSSSFTDSCRLYRHMFIEKQTNTSCDHSVQQTSVTVYIIACCFSGIAHLVLMEGTDDFYRKLLMFYLKS